jgi:hypothetical protein
MFYNWSRDALLTLLHVTINKIPFNDINEHEIIIQADKITEPLLIYKYMRGTLDAQLMPDLWRPVTCTVARDEVLEAETKIVRPIERAVILDYTPKLTSSHQAQRVERAERTTKPAQDFSTVAPLPIKQPWLK